MLFRIEEMVHYKAFWNHDVPDILFYNEISDLTDLKGTSAFMGAEKRFIKLLAIKDYKGAHQVLLESLDAGISKDMKRFPMERFRVFGLLSNLLETLLSQMPVGMEGEEADKLNGALRELLSQRSMEGLREKIDQLFGYVIAYKQQEQSSDAPAWVWKVRSYIEEHYDDPQLDVSLLAKEFSLNVSHLSRTYKKATSVGVLDNIHLVRIARAKEQLDLGCSVQQTSAKVGYLESRALIRAFKRYEGITPGQYQEATEGLSEGLPQPRKIGKRELPRNTAKHGSSLFLRILNLCRRDLGLSKDSSAGAHNVYRRFPAYIPAGDARPASVRPSGPDPAVPVCTLHRWTRALPTLLW